MLFSSARKPGAAAALCYVALLGGCADHGPGDHLLAGVNPSGECLVSEPGREAATGLSVFTLQRADPGADGPGSQALSVVCRTTGADGRGAEEVVELFLPNLQHGAVPPGEYHVRRADSPPDSAVPLQRIAWGRVTRGPGTGLAYTAEGGTVRILEAVDGTISGAYRIALRIADSTLASAASDPRLVLQGVFTAPEADSDAVGR